MARVIGGRKRRLRDWRRDMGMGRGRERPDRESLNGHMELACWSIDVPPQIALILATVILRRRPMMHDMLTAAILRNAAALVSNSDAGTPPGPRNGSTA